MEKYFEIIKDIHAKKRDFIFFTGYKVTTGEIDTQVKGDFYLERSDEISLSFYDNNNENIGFVVVENKNVHEAFLNGECFMLSYKNGLGLTFWLTKEAAIEITRKMQ